MAQVAGELLDLPGVVVAALGGEFGPQVADGLGLGEQADVDEVAGQGGVAAAGGDHSAAVRARGRPQVTPTVRAVQVRGVTHVVEHDQPSPVGGLGPGQEADGGPLRVIEARALRVVGVGHRDSGLGVSAQDRVSASRGDPHQQIHRPGLPRGAGVVGGELSLADPTDPSQHLAQHRRPTPGHRSLQGIDGIAVLETVRLPRDHAHQPRPRERRPRHGMVRHRIGTADHQGTGLRVERCLRRDVRRLADAGYGQRCSGPGIGGFPRDTSPIRRAAADPRSALMSA